MIPTQTRRRVLATLALVGAGSLVRPPPALAAVGALESTTLRLTRTPSLCVAPQYIAEELLRAEGFSDVRYVDTASATESANAIGRDEADLSFDFVSAFIIAIDAGAPITVLGGVHIGCYELFASEGIRTIAGLMGKSVGLDAAAPALLSLLAAEVGLDPERISAGSPAP